MIPVNRDELLKVSRETHHFMRNKIVQQIISQKKNVLPQKTIKNTLLNNVDNQNDFVI